MHLERSCFVHLETVMETVMTMLRKMKASPLLIALAALGPSRAVAAQAPTASAPARTPSADAAEAERPAGAPSTVGVPLRVGVIGGVGFPRPLAIEAMAEFAGLVAVGLEYGALPAVTIDGVSAGLWSLAGDVRIFPLRGAFFVGVRAGRQHVGATTTVALGSLGSATEVLALDSWFFNPRVVPLGPTTSSSLPLSLYPTAQRTVDALGRSVIPTIELLRVGLLL